MPSHSRAGDLEVEPNQRYLLLATSKTGTMKKELDEAASLGFRVVAGSRTSGAEMALFMERVATPPDTYRYELLATTRTGTMQKELDEASAKGFRLLPATLMQKDRLMGPPEIVAVLERAPDAEDGSYAYKLLATSRTSTLQKEVGESVHEGWQIVGMVSRDEHIVIMGKSKAP